VQIRRLASTEELFQLTGGDYLLRANVLPGAAGQGWIAEDGTVAYLGPEDGSDHDQWLDVIGDPGTAAVVLRHTLKELAAPPLGFSAPRGTDVDGIELSSESVETWDFMAWDASAAGAAPPSPPGEELVEALVPGPGVDAEISALLSEANPHHSTKPGWEGIRVWGGVRSAETGALLAVGALCHRGSGVPWLASIGTLPAERGRGYGAAVTAWLTRRGVETSGVCTLGHYVPNEVAQRIYLRLGYRTTHEMFSGRLA